jgi:WNK lysine deficient protein kinase
MVGELDITDQDVTSIADMIDGAIASLVPEWESGPGIIETPPFANQGFCRNCVSNHTSSGSLMEFLSHNQGNLQLPECCKHGCASMHGRFEEITFPSEEYDNHVRENLNISNRSDCLQYQGQWNQHESRELSPVDSDQSHSDEQNEQIDKSILAEDQGLNVWENKFPVGATISPRYSSGTHDFSNIRSLYCGLDNHHEKEMRWLKARYQMELRERKDQQLGLTDNKTSHIDIGNGGEHITDYAAILSLSLAETLNGGNNGIRLKPVNKSNPNSDTVRNQICEAMESSGGEGMVTAKSFYTGSLLPHSLHRTVSLPVDAVDI